MSSPTDKRDSSRVKRKDLATLFGENPPSFDKKYEYCKFIEEASRDLRDTEKKKLSRKTKRKIAATKHYFRQYYNELVLYLARRKLRGEELESFLASQSWPDEEKATYRQQQFEKESQYLRLRRRRTSLNDFTILALLGRGGYGEVYLTRKIDTGEILALKRMKKSKFTEKNEVLRVLKEREVMVKSRSPWLARLKYCFQTQTHLYMAMEYIPGGDLKNLLDHFGAVPEDEARFYIAEMILAVDDLHKLGYIHRDLKPDNFMIDKSGHLKLIDFGLSKDGWKQKFSKASIKFLRPNDPDGEEGHDDKKKKKKKKKKNLFVRGWTATWNLFSVREDKGRRKMYSVVGSPEYMAVEILSQEGYTESVDCWSLGVLLYEFVFGFTPFGAETALRVFNNIRNWAELLKRPPSIDGEELPVSSECWDLITKLVRAPEDRIGKGGVDELKRHAFFKGLDWNNIREMEPPFTPNLEDELDTTYFSGLAEEAVEEGGEDASIDALLNKELAKGGNDRDETSLSNIFSHKDRKKGKVVETENADLTQAKEAEGTENLKLKFNSSYTRFEFAAFTYKHEDLAGVGLNDLLRDLTSTPRGSPRLAESAPASPRGDHTPDDGGKIPKSPKPASPNIVRSPSDPDQRRGKVSRTPSLEPPQAGSSQPSVPHSESSPTIAVSVGKKHRRTPSSPNTALPPTSPRNHDSPPPESPTSESSGPFSKIKKRLSALRSIWKKDDDSGSAPNSPGASPERRGSVGSPGHSAPTTRGRSGTIDEYETPHVCDVELLEVKKRAHKRISEGRRNRTSSAPHPGGSSSLMDKHATAKERILAKARALAATESSGINSQPSFVPSSAASTPREGKTAIPPLPLLQLSEHFPIRRDSSSLTSKSEPSSLQNSRKKLSKTLKSPPSDRSNPDPSSYTSEGSGTFKDSEDDERDKDKDKDKEKKKSKKPRGSTRSRKGSASGSAEPSPRGEQLTGPTITISRASTPQLRSSGSAAPDDNVFSTVPETRPRSGTADSVSTNLPLGSPDLGKSQQREGRPRKGSGGASHLSPVVQHIPTTIAEELCAEEEGPSGSRKFVIHS